MRAQRRDNTHRHCVMCCLLGASAGSSERPVSDDTLRYVKQIVCRLIMNVWAIGRSAAVTV